ncbi:MAG: hypothetical protein MK193_14630 [Lentisphaeria bacterium]|nr:hypothetical protein [Lentisphaeria bacterium]
MIQKLITMTIAGLIVCGVTQADPAKRYSVLPGEQPAEDILNGVDWWPASPKADTSKVENEYFVADAFGKAPAPGVHPRILISPEDLPALRERIKNTISGRFFYHQITFNQEKSIRKEGTFSYLMLKALAAGNMDQAKKMIRGEVKTIQGQKYSHRYGFAYVLMSEAFDVMIREDENMGKEVSAAIVTLAKIYMERLEAMDKGFETATVISLDSESQDRFHGFRMNEAKTQFNSDVWRSGRRAAINGEPWLAFMYDYAYNFMTEEQRATVRATLNKYHTGKTTMGSHMPPHFRNWNWVPIGAGGLYLTTLATEGEQGNDARVIQHTQKILEDFVKYGWSDMGSSNEAISYTSFGLRWGVPALVAMARRGENVWGWKRWRGSVDWYAHSVQPNALDKPHGVSQRFMSHGDGGQGGPSPMTIGAFKRFYPNDPQVDFVAQIAGLKNKEDLDENGQYKIPDRGFYNAYPVEDLLMLGSDASATDHQEGRNLNYPNTFFDPERNSLITRSEWGPNQVQLQMEARNDSTSPNHMHADNGAFTLSGAGRVWADERFRGVESRLHSMVIIDGKGQGYFTPPADWLGLVDNEHITIGAVDSSYSYAWAWPGFLCGFTNPKDPRRMFDRWKRFAVDVDKYLAKNPDYKWRDHIDRHPTVEKFYKGFEKGDPRIWDEYGRPQRIEHNPVEKAMRSAMLVRGKFPYVVITDDIKKDNQIRLYEWLMMLPDEVELAEIGTHRAVLFDATYEGVELRAGFQHHHLPKGTPKCLITVLQRSLPKGKFTNPEMRFEIIEEREARKWPSEIKEVKIANKGGHKQKRFVIPSRSVEPKFKVLLYPHRQGDKTPQVKWNEAFNEVTITIGDQVDVISFTEMGKARTKVKVSRNGTILGEL